MKKITKQTYINWYRDMLFWRKFEDKLAAVYIQQKVRGFLHLYNGQEAILAGALHVMELGKRSDDYCLSQSCAAHWNGVDPKKVMAELYGKVTGTSNGLGVQCIFSLKLIVSTEDMELSVVKSRWVQAWPLGTNTTTPEQ